MNESRAHIDRIVFAEWENGDELVRYERSGKWYAESLGGYRELVTLDEAVTRALTANKVYQFRTGGAIFKSRYRKRIEGQL